MPDGTIMKQRLHFSKMGVAKSKRNSWFAAIPAGTDPKTLLKPDYWANCVKGIKPLDTIEAFSEDASWEALYRVMFVSPIEVRLSPIYEVRHGADEETVTSDTYEVAWKGPMRKYSVLMRATGEVIKEGFHPKSMAETFMLQHMKSLKE